MDSDLLRDLVHLLESGSKILLKRRGSERKQREVGLARTRDKGKEGFTEESERNLARENG